MFNAYIDLRFQPVSPVAPIAPAGPIWLENGPGFPGLPGCPSVPLGPVKFINIYREKIYRERIGARSSGYNLAGFSLEYNHQLITSSYDCLSLYHYQMGSFVSWIVVHLVNSV